MRSKQDAFVYRGERGPNVPKLHFETDSARVEDFSKICEITIKVVSLEVRITTLCLEI